MKSYTKSKCNWLILAGLIAISSCNAVNDPQPDDVETIPGQVVDLLERKFPKAQQMTINVVEKDKLWEATYSENSQDYYVGLDSNNVIATYKLISPNVPDSVAAALEKLAIHGGRLSDFRQNMDASSSYWVVYEAKYVLDGIEYLVSWEPQDRTIFTMNNYSKFAYKVSAMEKLPSNAKSFLRSENLRFLRGNGFVASNNTQRYDIYAQDASGYQFYFDSSGRLIFTEYNLQQVFLNEKDLPGPVLKLIQNTPLFKGFNFVSGIYNKSYKLILKKGNESFTVFVDDKANIIRIIYTGY